jgi:hypothetical protein
LQQRAGLAVDLVKSTHIHSDNPVSAVMTLTEYLS